mgnify:CR=1 FL=1
MSRLEQLEEILGGHLKAGDLLETVDMLEDKMDNQHDDVAREFYNDIRYAIGDLQAKVQEAKEFYE